MRLSVVLGLIGELEIIKAIKDGVGPTGGPFQYGGGADHIFADGLVEPWSKMYGNHWVNSYQSNALTGLNDMNFHRRYFNTCKTMLRKVFQEIQASPDAFDESSHVQQIVTEACFNFGLGSLDTVALYNFRVGQRNTGTAGDVATILTRFDGILQASGEIANSFLQAIAFNTH